jgi:hypothetical protein
MSEIPRAYDQWAPADGRWSAWVKPVLFHPMFWSLRLQAPPGDPPTHDATWAPPADGGWAIVIDAPGAEGVAIGLGLARRGFRPVPLYNGVPSLSSPLIDVLPILVGLEKSADELERLPLPADAPPAFLLDSRRMLGTPRIRSFDNRWVVTPQDLPSANRLRHFGINQVLVIEEPPVAEDLAAVLKRWQEGGVALHHQFGPERRPLDVPRPPHFRSLFERLAVMWGLRRSSAGGFGGYIPEPAKGGG